jgi:hypothetical protein
VPLDQVKPRAIQLFSDEIDGVKSSTKKTLPLRFEVDVKTPHQDSLVRGITANGDSGAPLIQESKDGKKKIIGILSGGQYLKGSSSSFYAQLDLSMRFKIWVMQENLQILQQNTQNILNQTKELDLINESDLVCSTTNKYTLEFLKSSTYLEKTKGLELYVRKNKIKEIFYSFTLCKSWLEKQLEVYKK